MNLLKIKNKKDARKKILAVTVFFFFGVMQAVFSFAYFKTAPMQGYFVLAGAALYLFCALFVWRFVSRIAAVTLFLFVTYGVLLRLYENFIYRPNVIGLVIMILLWVVALQSMRAVFYLHK